MSEDLISKLRLETREFYGMGLWDELCESEKFVVAEDTKWQAADALESALAEVERLRDIIKRRLDCDGSNGTWLAHEHFELTKEMHAAVGSKPDA